MEPETLNRLLERLKGLFPPEAPLRLLPSAGPEAWAAVAARSCPPSTRTASARWPTR